jgi:uncharacterized protein (TIGR04141 family)
LKPEFDSPADTLTNSAPLTQFPLPNGLTFSGRLYLYTPAGKPPIWLDFLQTGLGNLIGHMNNVSNGALLFVSAGDRLIAFTFGHVRHFLRPGAIERDFGIKVALNVVDPNELRSVDVDTFEDMTMRTRRQTSRGSGVGSFGLDISQVLRGVTGKPQNTLLASRVTGSDSLQLTTPLDFGELGKKSLELIDAYNSTAYKDSFPWFDDLRTVRTESTLNELNEKLIGRLKAKALAGIYLAPPDVVDWQLIGKFSYSTDQDQLVDDLDMEAFVETLEDIQGLTLETLKQEKAYSHWADSGNRKDTWPVLDCVVFEVEHDGELFVLTGGRWFSVSTDLVQSVDADAERLAKAAINLPAFTKKKHKDEKGYNDDVSKRLPHLGLADRKTLQFGGGYSKVEVCDLFSSTGQFIHVKRKTRSSTLSHLFGQGAVSGQAFLQAKAFREDFRKLFPNGSEHSALVPESKPNAADYDVAFAIVAEDSGNWPKSLPFFSKLHLQQTASRLELWNYRVSLSRIDDLP